MSLYADPEQHAENPPHTWHVVKQGRRYALVDSVGQTLGTYERKRDAEEGRVSGPWVTLWEKEAAWYAGKPVANWKAYVPA